ncbi:unnamed protein product, partial [Symbiodinium sp. CCMP2592]
KKPKEGKKTEKDRKADKLTISKDTLAVPNITEILARFFAQCKKMSFLETTQHRTSEADSLMRPPSTVAFNQIVVSKITFGASGMEVSSKLQHAAMAFCVKKEKDVQLWMSPVHASGTRVGKIQNACNEAVVFDPRVPRTFIVGNGAGKAPKEPIFALTAVFLKGEVVEDGQAKLAKLGFQCTGAKKLASLPFGLAEPKARVKLSSKLFKE